MKSHNFIAEQLYCCPNLNKENLLQIYKMQTCCMPSIILHTNWK